jgi:hypothetical protein
MNTSIAPRPIDVGTGYGRKPATADASRPQMRPRQALDSKGIERNERKERKFAARFFSTASTPATV